MYKLCKTERSAKRQREIEHALLDLMTEKHYETISVTELCEKMVIPRKAFYRYFDSKDDALQALLEHTMAEYDGFVHTPGMMGRRSLKLELEQFFAFWKKQRRLLDALNYSGLLGKVVQTTTDYPIDNVIELEKFLPGDSDRVRTHVFKFALCGLISMTMEWYQEGFAISTSDMAALACRMLAHPLFPNLDTIGIFE